MYILPLSCFGCGASTIYNWEMTAYGSITYDTLIVTNPVNGSTNNARSNTLQWKSSYFNNPYNYTVSTSPTLSPIYSSGTVNSYSSYYGVYYYYTTPTIYFSPNTTYYWRATDAFSNMVNGSFTTIDTEPVGGGILNVSVYDETTGDRLYVFDTTVYGTNGQSITLSTDYGWTNFSSSQLSVGDNYIVTVTPPFNLTTTTSTVTSGSTSSSTSTDTTSSSVSIYGYDGSNITNVSTNTTSEPGESTTIITGGYSNTSSVIVGSGYYPRTQITSVPNSNLIFYVPQLNVITDNIVHIIFTMTDITGRFPFRTSYLTITANNSVMYSNYFDGSAKVPVYLIKGNIYTVSVTNTVSGEVFAFGNYMPSRSIEEQITASDFSTNISKSQPFGYNVTSTFAQITLNWIDRNNAMNSLVFNVYNNTNNVCTITSSANSGQFNCITGNNDVYKWNISVNMTDGTFVNSSEQNDYNTTGVRQTSNGISSTTGEPIGTGFIFNRGTFVMPEWVYTWASLIVTILILASFGALYGNIGSVITCIIALILEFIGLYRPLSSSIDPYNYITMTFTGVLLLMAVLSTLNEKDE